VQVNLDRGKGVGQVGGAFDRGGVDAALDHPALERGAGENRLADNAMLPRHHLVVGV
jgi:hypothetical protein